MPSRHALSISLTAHLQDFIDAQVASGRFGTASEVVRAGLRLLERELGSQAQDGADEPAVASAVRIQGRARPPTAP